jgi:hypothetical protein
MKPTARAALLDGSTALGLLVALSLVFAADRSKPPVTATDVQPALVATQQEEELAATKALRLAVTPPQYDDMGKLLHQLGSGYSYTDIRLEDLEDGAKLAGYDVVFFTCGTDANVWLTDEELGGGGRPGVKSVRFNENAVQRVRQALRAFVGKGGTLYASDWRLTLIRLCFDELAQEGDVVSGAKQTITADVVDRGLSAGIGSTVELKFDLDNWRPARLTAAGATVYIQGRYRAFEGGTITESPLLVRVPFEQGAIIFTSFHNEKVNSELETKLLQFLVFAAVTAKETQRSRATMLTGGFVPHSESLLDASPSSPTVTQTYDHARSGKLRFALSFNNQGARLKLSVRAPDGSTQEREGMSTFSIDIDNAAAGRWSYTITALKLPHEHFPYSLTIGGE